MATLARLQHEAERLRSGRRIFVSSESVSAYKVANNRKQLLEGDHPLVLSLPDDDYSSGASMSLLEASVGPELHWTLSSINHVLRTASKWGEPTYLFANILDTDPQAFVAVTLNKRTPNEELEHLEGVISRVSHFHVAESKPMQVPGPDQVVAALGKGLMKLVLGGGSSSKQKGGKSASHSPPPRTAGGPYQQQAAKTSDQERAEYLASLEQRGGGGHVAAVDRPGVLDMHAGAHRDDDRLGEEVPTAPVLPVNRTAMGVGSRREADARLAALKAGMREEGAPPTAPGVYSSSDTRPTRSNAYPSLPSDDTLSPQQRGTTGDWQSHTAGTLGNPFTGGGGSSSSAGARDPPHTISYDDYLSRDEQWGAPRGSRGATHKTPDVAPAGVYDAGGYGQGGRTDYADAGWGVQGGDRDRVRDKDSSRPSRYDDHEQQRLRYQQEAREAREEWERTQREAAARRAAAESAPNPKPRVRYHEVRDDAGGGWGNQQPGYACAGGQGGQQPQQKQQQQQQQKRKQQAPDWLEVLGKVFAGGPAYAGHAPDL